jgi:hypothetical protein
MGWWLATITLTPRVDNFRPGKNYIFNALFISFLYFGFFCPIKAVHVKSIPER